jgi:hypothetical protein
MVFGVRPPAHPTLFYYLPVFNKPKFAAVIEAVFISRLW